MGDTYSGLDADSLSDRDLDFAQKKYPDFIGPVRYFETS